MKGNLHVRFLGGLGRATAQAYPVPNFRLNVKHLRNVHRAWVVAPAVWTAVTERSERSHRFPQRGDDTSVGIAATR